MDNKTIFTNVVEAMAAIEGHIRKTPLEYSQYLSKETGAEVFLKLENFQITGSFKIRGAFNAALKLREKGVETFITASTGNHGSACAYAAEKLGMTCKVYMPENAAKTKIDYLKFLGAEIIPGGIDCLEAETEGKRLAAERGIPYLSPYNDPLILAGQGTIALETMNELETPDVIFAPVGGGGLMTGISGYAKSKMPEIKMIAAQPLNSCVMYHSIKAGEILDLPSISTLADGVAGGIEPGSITFMPCKNNIDRFILLNENEIAEAVKIFLDRHFMLVEGSGALALAALLKDRNNFKGKKVVLIVSGAKISREKLMKIFNS